MSKKLLANVGNTVVDNYRRYYQEYEGTFIAATNKSEDDTIDTSRCIEVTEIWGNTVQDENNLEDIQSVGELYVDDEGNPILDDLGREQYKIEIENFNDFHSNLDRITLRSSAERLNYNTFKLVGSLSWNSEVHFICNGNRIPIGTKFKIRLKVISLTDVSMNNSSITAARKLTNYLLPNFDYSKLNEWQEIEFTTNKEDISTGIKIFVLGLKKTATSDVEMVAQVEVIMNDSKQSNKTTILLPCQLQKVGDVYDRLYWDSEKEKYVVDKKVKNFKTTPQLIETNITEKILLPCYEEKTHIFVNSTVDTTMKVLVPYKEII